MVKKYIFLISLIYFLVNVQSVSALIIFDNGAPNQAGASHVSGSQSADDFFVNSGDIGASTFLLTDVHFWTWETAGWTGDISWFVYADDMRLDPGTLLSSGSAVNIQRDFVQALNGVDEYSYWFDLDSAITLNADTWYWLGLQLPTNQGVISWEGSRAQQLGDTIFGQTSVVGGGLSSHSSGDLAFYLTSPDVSVPEPATMTLLGIGLVGLVGASARRKLKKKVVVKS